MPWANRAAADGYAAGKRSSRSGLQMSGEDADSLETTVVEVDRRVIA